MFKLPFSEWEFFLLLVSIKEVVGESHINVKGENNAVIQKGGK